MSETSHKYVLRFETQGGKLVSAEMKTMGKDGVESFKKLEEGAKGVDHRMSLLAQTVAKRLIPIFSASALAGAVRGAVKSLSDLGNEAKRLGVTVERLQELRLTAKDFGIDEATADAAFSGFIQKISEAQQGVGNLVPILKFYNIELRNANGQQRDWMDILKDLSGVVAGLGTEQEKMFLASKIGMTEFLELLRQGPDAFDKHAAAARESGVIVDEHLVKRAMEFDKAWESALTRFSVNMKTKIMDAAADIADLISGIRGIDPDLDTIEGRIARLQRRRSGGQYQGDAAFARATEEKIADLEKKREEMKSSPEYIAQQQKDLLSKIETDYESRTKDKNEKTLKEYLDEQNEIKKAREESIKLSEREQEKIQNVIESPQYKTEQMGRDALQQEIHNQLRAAGVDLYSREGQQIAKLVEEHYALEQAQERNQQAAKLLGDAIRGTASAFTDLRTYALNTLADIAEALVNLSTGGSAGNSIGGALATGLYGIFSGSTGSGYDPAVSAPPRKPGFAFGGSFMVGGPGGTDKTPIDFMATRGERVTIETPAQQRANGSAVNLTIINQSNAQIETRRTGQGGRDMEVVLTESMGKAISAGKMDAALASRYGLRPGTTA